MLLKDKVAIVTGARQGIGLGIATAFAREGASVVVSDIKSDGLDQVVQDLESLGGEVISVSCDVSKRLEVEAMVEKTIERFGKLDILVNNAGIFPFKPFLDISEDDWNKVLDINLKGAFLSSQVAVRAMKAGGKVVNISSIASLVGFEGLTHYCASKGGINSLTRALALELAGKKINVNAVAPGSIETPGALKAITDEIKKETIDAIPWKRMGTPDDIAQAVVFLSSDKSDYITGQTLVVDGGWTLH